MTVVGRGRIVFWEGASLWLLKVEQEAAELQPHAHHAIQITFQLEGSFEIGVSSECLTGPVAAVWSDTSHSFRASGAVALLFVAPESSVGRALGKTLFAHRRWANVTSGPFASSLEDLRRCFRSGFAEEELLCLGQQIMEALPKADGTALPDQRALAMIAYARKNLENTVTLPSAADHVCLSDSRARHVFAAQTGLPFKTFVLWLRLERAVALYARGISLTEAAHEAGFADSAHFSRTFRRTFGLPAAALSLLHN
ncbi:MAG: AraC family transcriptional regulator [Sphingorhabdus sp.]|uniref:helix-turn-helix transcriptional regulator n=1 Tax=Sphingorhabdus sp. TaxID=1902408 RepID=UPI0038FCC8D6